jgi:large conductance mechanosensitive channel
MSGFRKFLLRGNVVDLAIAVMIGAAFATVVSAFTGSFITPLLAAIGGKPDFASLLFRVNGTAFTYGLFLNALISFVILAAILYFVVVLPINRLMDRFKPAPDEPTPTKDCLECMSSIPAAARRCAYCTSAQAG